MEVEKNQEKIVKEYAQAFRQFANVSGSAQRILVTMPNLKDEILKKGEINSQFISSILSEGDPHKPANQQPIIYHISDYVVDPQDASNVPITKLYESIDYMTYISNQIQKIEPNQSMIADRNNVIDNTNIKNSINSNKIIFQKLKEV